MVGKNLSHFHQNSYYFCVLPARSASPVTRNTCPRTGQKRLSPQQEATKQKSNAPEVECDTCAASSRLKTKWMDELKTSPQIFPLPLIVFKRTLALSNSWRSPRARACVCVCVWVGLCYPVVVRPKRDRQYTPNYVAAPGGVWPSACVSLPGLSSDHVLVTLHPLVCGKFIQRLFLMLLKE